MDDLKAIMTELGWLDRQSGIRDRTPQQLSPKERLKQSKLKKKAKCRKKLAKKSKRNNRKN